MVPCGNSIIRNKRFELCFCFWLSFSISANVSLSNQSTGGIFPLLYFFVSLANRFTSTGCFPILTPSHTVVSSTPSLPANDNLCFHNFSGYKSTRCINNHGKTVAKNFKTIYSIANWSWQTYFHNFFLIKKSVSI